MGQGNSTTIAPCAEADDVRRDRDDVIDRARRAACPRALARERAEAGR